MNLLGETKSAISRSGHSTDDVRFVGSRDEKLGIPWSQAEKVLDIDYDDGYGSQEIAADLVVVFTDGGFRRREEYDGSILKADNHQGSDRWDVYVSKTVYPTAESCGTLAGVPRMLADDVEVEIMAREKEMGGGQ